MAAEAEIDAGGTAAGAKKPGNRRMLMIIGGAVVVVLLLGAGGYFFLFANKHADAAADAAVAAVPQSFIFNLPQITVNLSSADNTESFMKLTVALEVANQDMMTQIQPRLAKVMDAFQVYLRELRKSDLEGSAGIYRLKEELLRRVNVAIAPAQIENILFKEILVQ
ncbi:MAG TPA: flagellar basal body-associated FliL family protein [Devosiaceae bacterium]|jgi:flagellar FliL protein